MEGIDHRIVSVNGNKMHIAEKGQGPVVLFLHGFPELWYSWRHQIHALSSLGYHAVAPDLRGFGDTEAPTSITSYTCDHIVNDLVALIDSLGVEQVFLVAHDWGAIMGWYLCLFKPERVKAFVCLSVPFTPRSPQMKPMDRMRGFFEDDYYICRFQQMYSRPFSQFENQVHPASLKEMHLESVPMLQFPCPLGFQKKSLLIMSQNLTRKASLED
ncbi:epoxide hydrolase 1-like isoform X2 [Castanea sativa]|uniref:epoxide hydrolase 1-like isoform X2 n=1 Tax=Castanea sativa TaxID=21020 RepID=UPI003F649A49